MPENITQWEYRVQEFGSFWGGVKAAEMEAALNEWGEQGWEVVSTHVLENMNKVNVIAKRPLTDRVKRMRSMPSYNNQEYMK
jgi:hypothetical protein